ncbi:hypothetical protein H2204_011274 [Knufia peltigerae]|uniref:cyclin-dependent kinase n=1 Tax=Knufia peltigerae TaxID=1002370 RepID=A0AA38XUJ1_9EURO|nr:hypothetical protein H2204_011274 [Knufia peltigerae]
MDSGTYSVYAKDRILPFFNQRKLSSQGANSHVYAFEIHDEYRDFPHAQEVTLYARKELDKDSEFAFHMENRNLNLAKTLQDAHIVKMIKPYKHGDTFNLIFAYAKTNLDDMLRRPGSDLLEAVPGPIESRHPSRPEHLGVHFDLKPANILIDNNDIWMISDFGQAVFKPTGDTTSRMVNQGGTLAYAPPEMNIDAKSSRRYDIWSLGCIALEVFAFALLGPRGLNGCEGYRGLDQVRRTSNSANGQEDSALWYEEGDRKYRVKPATFEFMRFLESTESLQHRPSSLSFVTNIIDLIKKMLEPVADDRIDIGEVIRLLTAAIDESNDETPPLQMTSMEGETSIGESELRSIRLWNLRDQEWKLVKLVVFEDYKSNLRICTVAQRRDAVQEYLNRMRDQLIPAYAFEDPFASSTADEAIYFSNIEPSDVATMQELFTMQKIEAIFAFRNIKYRKHKSFTKHLAHSIQRHEDNEDGIDLGPGWAQIWVEQTDSARKAREDNLDVTTSPTRPVRIQPHQRADDRVVPPRRLVIFIHKLKAYMTIQVDKNWWEDPDLADASTSTIHFTPRKANRDPSFPASILRHAHIQGQNHFPGIPLCPQNLLQREQRPEVMFECTFLRLTFDNEETKKLLSQKFTGVKNQ